MSHHTRNFDRNEEEEVCVGSVSESYEIETINKKPKVQQRRKEDLKPRKSVYHWSRQETGLFYLALRKYGANMELIARDMRNTKIDRNTVLVKFKYEQKTHSGWVRNAMSKIDCLPFYTKC
ncbi:hypothetical protein EIN_034860 [Entamoeba invadens IP1]|uniref:Transcription factor TFIIIB component B'' Myb domain-containing protein n=1 Tax=Entamoeba invadens IP1 TaxID=370355 RepID=A0A0A1TYG1_ENTIV|nr:hypothetical protein EIN_034860 [Entamoeba invadens IP1]ELP86525.1 hypothetical protein EIN_034860 [Entamoeba invadens IP1]|eukprot:XP_004185871.1 hypothetical protein EIN_034860 [Entamoeba invadens IP1]